MKNTGTNTMQMHSVATNAGTAICCAPSRIACSSGLRMPMLRWMFSISTVASSTRMPTARPRPPSVIVLSVCPSDQRQITDTSIDNGMLIAITSVERHEPRKSRITSPVSTAASTASLATPSTAARTNTDWSTSGVTSTLAGSVARIGGSASFTRCTISSVEEPVDLSTVSSALRAPSTCTMLVCVAKPSRTCATSRR